MKFEDAFFFFFFSNLNQLYPSDFLEFVFYLISNVF